VRFFICASNWCGARVARHHLSDLRIIDLGDDVVRTSTCFWFIDTEREISGCRDRPHGAISLRVQIQRHGADRQLISTVARGLAVPYDAFGQARSRSGIGDDRMGAGRFFIISGEVSMNCCRPI